MTGSGAGLGGSTVALATKHGKAAVVAPPFEALGARIVVAAIDTDLLGTFAGDVPRPGDALAVVAEKARRGAAALTRRYGLASEGQFGPDPALPFMARGVEHLALVDTDRDLVWVETVAGPETNFARHVGDPAGVERFLARIGFPEHAVLVRPADWTPGDPFVAGIADRDVLAAALKRFGPGAAIDTDMRAHLNPTRRAMIARAADALARRMAVACPACGTAGFGRVAVRRGLVCSACGTPTGLVAAEIHGCVACGHREERPRPDGRAAADPADCPICNP